MDVPETIHVSLSIWDLADAYNTYAAVTIVSLLENTPKLVHIHLLYDEKLHASDPCYKINREYYASIEKKYGCKITFHHVDAPSWLEELPSVRFFTFGTFLRLFLPDVLPDIDKVIYLDCDICVSADISGLWNSNLYGKAIAADDVASLNAGVLILNLNKIRSEYQMAKMTLEFLNDHPRTKYLDQDAIQAVFFGDISVFERKWNVTTPHHLEFEGQPAVFHFNWIKPWKVYSGGTYAEIEFWKYFSKTPWGSDPKQYIHALATCSDLSLELVETVSNRLLYYPLGYRFQYWCLFTWALIRINFRELKVRIMDFFHI